MRARLLEFGPGLVAGLLGGLGGYALMSYLLTHQGLRVPILPGALAGLACGQASAVVSQRRGIANALIVLVLVVYAQWKLYDPPFDFDGTLRDYTLHLHQLPGLTLILLAINVVLGYWWGREQGIGFARFRPKAQPPKWDDLDRMD